MDPVPAAAAIAGLVAVSTLAGLLWRARDGRVRPASAVRYMPGDFGDGVSFGSRATLVQFSTEFCARCPSSERMLRTVASAQDGIAVAVVDLTARADLASRFRVSQTPTVLVLDADGRQLARSGGVPQRAAIEAALPPDPAHTLTRSSHASI